MPAPVTPRSVVDTCGDPVWQPLRVTVRLDEPLVADLHRPLHLDGALAWCAYLEWVEAAGHRPPPIRRHESPLDFEVGLATWTAPPSVEQIDGRALGADGMAWGHACAPFTPVPRVHTAAATRRRPPTEQMARYTRDRRHHLGAGPYKARDSVHPAAWVGDITWHALGDPDRVAHLLTRLTHVGRLGRHGYGRVQRIEVIAGSDRDRWRTGRTMPTPGGQEDTIRAPHWHPTRRMPCA